MLTVAITADGFYNDYSSINKTFSYDGAIALYEYIEEYALSSGEKNFLINPNDWAIEWSEYSSKDDAVSCLGYDSWEQLSDDVATFEFETGVLVCDY